MLYPTHKRYGILWGFLMIPIAVLMGLIPTVTVNMGFNDILLVILTVYMAMRGALFGARFPDIDSPGSIPARRHPYLRKIFAFFKIKHRGKFSHDFASITALFLGIYFIIAIFGKSFLVSIPVLDSSFINTLVYITGLVFVYMVGIDIVEFMEYCAEKSGNKQLRKKLDQNQLKLALINVALMLVGMSIGGTINVSEVTEGVQMSNSLMIATMLYVSLQVYVIFTLVGAYSHLVADMTTKQGVSIFGIKLAPMQVIAKVRKIPLIGVLLCPTEFKTGSGWEDTVRFVIGLLCIPSGILAFMVVFGFDLFKILGF